MFSGIIEKMAQVVRIEKEQGNKHFTFRNPFVDDANKDAQRLFIDQSVSHKGSQNR